MSINLENTGDKTIDYFLNYPHKLLSELNCNKIFCCYSYLGGVNLPGRNIAKSLKFDEYKYAITGVPFRRKWTLCINRNSEREDFVINQLNIDQPFVLLHDEGSNVRAKISIPDDVQDAYRIVKITNLTDNPFDWLGVIERANKLFFIDSFFSNLVEQLNLCRGKHLILRSEVPFTPVFKNDWTFI